MLEPAGAQWCAHFLPSAAVVDLTVEFARKVAAFIGRLTDAGCTVSIADTYRPPQRAYLMHWCCMIGGAGQDPAAVPAMPGVDIDWTCGGDRVKAKAAAQAMMAGYQIKFPAALASRHTQRRAIDMTIKVPAGATILDCDGHPHHFDAACLGTDPRVVAIGKTFGVMKLANDAPHWSDDGH